MGHDDSAAARVDTAGEAGPGAAAAAADLAAVSQVRDGGVRERAAPGLVIQALLCVHWGDTEDES